MLHDFMDTIATLVLVSFPKAASNKQLATNKQEQAVPRTVVILDAVPLSQQ
jgi:hypothetical protein